MLQPFKKIMLWGLVVLAMGAIRAANADENISRAQVEGHARFEKRMSIVPFSLCNGRNCETSHIYWSLVVENPVMRYELNEPFAPGSAAAPESIQLKNLLVRPGSILRMMATVESVSRGYAIISEVSDVHLVMDEAILESDHSMNMGWSCEGSTPSGSSVYVQVWYQCSGTDRSNAAYHLRILTDQRGALRPVVTVNNAQEHLDHSAVLYSGSQDSTKVQLSIAENGVSTRDLPSVLKVTQMAPELSEGLPEITDDLRCSRTRNFD